MLGFRSVAMLPQKYIRAICDFTANPQAAGTLLLNGPALWELPRGRLEHWFDGYAMWHAIRIEVAGVRYRSRFAASESYRRSIASGAPAYGEFGTANPAGLLHGCAARRSPTTRRS